MGVFVNLASETLKAGRCAFLALSPAWEVALVAAIRAAAALVFAGRKPCETMKPMLGRSLIV